MVLKTHYRPQKLRFEQKKMDNLLCWSWRIKSVLVSELHGTIFEAILVLFIYLEEKQINPKKYSSVQSVD